MPLLVFIFIVLPIAELVVLIEVGSEIGAFPTIGLLFLTAVVGVALLKRQGLATLTRVNQRLNSGELPAKEVIEGMVLALGGVLLLVPGFITDAVGLLCLLPGTRHWLMRGLLKRTVVHGRHSGFFFSAGSGPFHGQGPFGSRSGDNDPIEGEYRDETERDQSRIEKK